MSVDIDQSGKNSSPVQVDRLSTGTGASRKAVVVAEGEDSAVTHCHGADHTLRSVQRNDVAVAQKQVGILACLGAGKSAPYRHERY
jgi:hypothetical protein